MASVRSARSQELLKQLKTMDLKANQKLPAEASDMMKEMGALAAELVGTRHSTPAPKKTGVTPDLIPDCSQFNTWWNAFLFLLGFCDAWEECMFGCD